jgi:hypothetical protein
MKAVSKYSFLVSGKKITEHPLTSMAFLQESFLVFEFKP